MADGQHEWPHTHVLSMEVSALYEENVINLFVYNFLCLFLQDLCLIMSSQMCTKGGLSYVQCVCTPISINTHVTDPGLWCFWERAIQKGSVCYVSTNSMPQRTPQVYQHPLGRADRACSFSTEVFPCVARDAILLFVCTNHFVVM